MNTAAVVSSVVTETPVNVNITQPAKRGPGRPRTKVTLKRVVLLNGKPVGRGRPNKNGKSTRTFVFIPIDQTFDVTVHGTGSGYRADRCKTPIKRVDIAKFNKLVKLPATAAAVKAGVVTV